MRYRRTTESCSYPINSSLTMAEASCEWVEHHGQVLKPNTVRSYNCALKVLKPFFGSTVLKEIRIDHIRRYQEQRSHRADPYLINSEVGVLRMIMKQSGEWKRIEEFYRPLRVPKRRAGHSLSQEEEKRLREIAFSRPKWQLAAHCIMVMLSTTMGFGELSQLRRRDIDMQRRCVTVREGAKNIYRERTIPLNTSAYESVVWIINRWEKLGGCEDEHYILPHRPRSPKGSWLFDEPMTAIRSAFSSIKKEAGLSHFRVYDYRVQAITKLLSNPAVSPQVSKEIAGHISQAMQDRYSIQQFNTKKAAFDALEVNPEEQETAIF